MVEKRQTIRCDLMQDRKGMMWDTLLYIPTVVALASIAASFWYGDDHNMAYLFFFLACFFSFAGFNRVFKTRLMLLPSAPVSLEFADSALHIVQKNGVSVHLAKTLRYYPDYSGKTFGVSGLNGSGQQMQFVFHKGQFKSVDEYDTLRELLKAVPQV